MFAKKKKFEDEGEVLSAELACFADGTTLEEVERRRSALRRKYRRAALGLAFVALLVGALVGSLLGGEKKEDKSALRSDQTSINDIASEEPPGLDLPPSGDDVAATTNPASKEENPETSGDVAAAVEEDNQEPSGDIAATTTLAEEEKQESSATTSTTEEETQEPSVEVLPVEEEKEEPSEDIAAEITTLAAEGEKLEPPEENKTREAVGFSAVATQQIDSFRNGEGILLNLNPSHHGGTTVCAEIKDDLTYPSFSCIHPTAKDQVSGDYPDYAPWTYEDTEKNVQAVRQSFQFLSWPFQGPMVPEQPQIGDMDWENPHLVSLFVARDPLSRALAGDGTMAAKYPNIWQHQNGTHVEWWQFAHEETHTNNFALWVLSNYTCCDGAKTDPAYLEMAKKMIERFTFILDVECLEQGLEKVAEILGFSLRHNPRSYEKLGLHEASVKDRIPFPEVYQYLKEKNKMDIELYRWAKRLSLVNCDQVHAAEELNEQSTADEAMVVAVEGSPPSTNPLEGISSLQGIGAQDSTPSGFSAVATQQIDSFRNGEGLLLNLNPSHHGGTTVCAEIKDDLTYPSFSCIHPTAKDQVSGDYPDYAPWTFEDTEKNVQAVRQSFQFLSWPFQGPMVPEQPQIGDMDWENPHLVSLFVARDPLSRALAGDGTMAAKYPNIWQHQNGTHVEWWQFAHEETHTNNFALWVLSNYTCCDGAKTDPEYLEMAKKMIERFTFILDVECLEQGLEKVAEILGFSLRHNPRSYEKLGLHEASVKDRIPFPEVYQYLKEKNKMDIELYGWAKRLSLVNCDQVHAAEELNEQSTADEAMVVAVEGSQPPTHPLQGGSSLPGIGAQDGTPSGFSAVATQQIDSFKNGDGILLNVNPSHHGGTTVCAEIKDDLTYPSFSCIHPTAKDGVSADYPDYAPWAYNDTEKNVQAVRQSFQFLSWPFQGPMVPEQPQIADVDWENPHLVSLFVARDPLSRSLVGDGTMAAKYPNIFKYQNGTHEEWWQFAHEDTHTNNFALWVLSNYTCCNGHTTPPEYLEMAKQLAQRFTFILDVECLEQGLEKVAETLGFSLRHNPKSYEKLGLHEASVKERIPFPEVYQYLKEKNKMDIELYEWAKSRALVSCDQVQAVGEEAAAAVVVEESPPANPLQGTSSLPGNGAQDSTHSGSSAIATQQISSFKNGEGLLLNLNVAHHGGTTVCAEIKDDLTYPSFSCIHPTSKDQVSGDYPDYAPWTYEDTEKNVQAVRQSFQFLSWPFQGPKPPDQPQIADMDWENPHLVSLFVARDPLSRALAGDGTMAAKYPNIWQHKNGTHVEWWQFAHEETHTNNFALWVLSDDTCCDGASTSPEHLEMAKKLVQRFTFVLDVECLEQGLEKVAETLGFSLRHNPRSYEKLGLNQPPVKDRIPFPEVYQYLKEKNKLDIELYEWAKSIALVDCASVMGDESAEGQEGAVAGERPPQSSLP